MRIPTTRSQKTGFCIAPTDPVDLLLPNAVWGGINRRGDQPAEFRASGMTSMQDFLSQSLERQVVGITIELVLMGLVLGMIGAYGAAERRQARQALADEHIR